MHHKAKPHPAVATGAALELDHFGEWIGSNNSPNKQSAQADSVPSRALHREIAATYQAQRRDKRPPLTSLRLADLRTVRLRQFGDVMPDTPASRYLCRQVAVHLTRGPEAPKRIQSWLSLYAPWWTVEEVSALVEEVGAIDDDTGQFVVPLPTADQLGWGLRITREQRSAWELTTIGAIDDSSAKRKARRKASARAREAARREAAGATPRAKSKAQTRPWAALGMSRASWYRRGRPSPAGAVNVTAVKNGVRNLRQIRAHQFSYLVITKASQSSAGDQEVAKGLAKTLGALSPRAHLTKEDFTIKKKVA